MFCVLRIELVISTHARPAQPVYLPMPRHKVRRKSLLLPRTRRKYDKSNQSHILCFTCLCWMETGGRAQTHPFLVLLRMSCQGCFDVISYCTKCPCPLPACPPPHGLHSQHFHALIPSVTLFHRIVMIWCYNRFAGLYETSLPAAAPPPLPACYIVRKRSHVISEWFIPETVVQLPRLPSLALHPCFCHNFFE